MRAGRVAQMVECLPKKKEKKKILSQAWVVHSRNPNYKEGSWFKANPGKQLKRPYLKNYPTQKGLTELFKW
jgi:hypothetical protein